MLEIQEEPTCLKYLRKCFITALTLLILVLFYMLCQQCTILFSIYTLHYIYRPHTQEYFGQWVSLLLSDLHIALHVFMKLGRTHSKWFCFPLLHTLSLPMISVWDLGKASISGLSFCGWGIDVDLGRMILEMNSIQPSAVPEHGQMLWLCLAVILMWRKSMDLVTSVP